MSRRASGEDGEGLPVRRKTGVIILVLVLLPFVLYHASLRLPFLCDDFLLFAHVSGASYHADPDPLSAYQLITPALTRASPQTVPWWTSPQTRLHFLRPLATLTLMLDHRLYGDRPAGYHFTNLWLHALVLVSLFLAGRRLLRDEAAAFLGVLIFTSPVSTAFVVSWVADRISILALLWGLLGLYFHMGARIRERRAGKVLAWVCFLLAFLSKESGAVFIGVYFLYDAFVWRRERPDRWPGLLPLVFRYALLCIPLGLFVLYFAAAGYGVSGHYSILDEGGTVWSTVGYLIKNVLLYATALLFFTPLTHEMNLLLFRQLVYLLPFLAMIVLALLLFLPGVRRGVFRDRAYPFLLCWLLVSLLPVLTLLPQNRYLYAVSAPFGLMMGGYLVTMKRSRGFGRLTRPVFALLVGFWVLLPMTVICLKPSIFQDAFQQQTRIVQETGRILDEAPAPAGPPANLVFLNLPSWVEVLALQYAFDFQYGKGTFRVFPLTVSAEVPEVEVLDAHSLRLRSPVEPFLASAWEKLFMVEVPDRQGFTASNDLFTATVEEVRDGHVHGLRFDFPAGLENPSTRIFTVEDGTVRAFDPARAPAQAGSG